MADDDLDPRGTRAMLLDEIAELEAELRAARASNVLLHEIAVQVAMQEDPSYSPKLGDITCRYCGAFGTHDDDCAWLRARVVFAPPTTRSIENAIRETTDRLNRGQCRSLEQGTPLRCEYTQGHVGPHSFDGVSAPPTTREDNDD